MKYALNLAADKRILSACKVLADGHYKDMPIVETLPEGNLYDYLYDDGEYIFDAITDEKRETGYLSSISYEKAVNMEIRKRYSISAEFALLRQKGEKTEEYAEYYAYCEECKRRIKEEIDSLYHEETEKIATETEEDNEDIS